MTKEELEKQVKKFAISYWRKRNRIGDNFSVLDLINFTTDFATEVTKELEAQIEQLVYFHNEDVNTIKLLNEQIAELKRDKQNLRADLRTARNNLQAKDTAYQLAMEELNYAKSHCLYLYSDCPTQKENAELKKLFADCDTCKRTCKIGRRKGL